LYENGGDIFQKVWIVCVECHTLVIRLSFALQKGKKLTVELSRLQYRLFLCTYQNCLMSFFNVFRYEKCHHILNVPKEFTCVNPVWPRCAGAGGVSRSPLATVQNSFMGPTWIVRCSTRPVIKLSIRHPRKKVRERISLKYKSTTELILESCAINRVLANHIYESSE